MDMLQISIKFGFAFLILGAGHTQPYIIAKFFQGGYRTKMKIRSENFSRASGVQKKGFPNFSPAAGFFVVEALENR